MATLEERVAYLEGKVEEHSRGLDGVREAVAHLEQRIDARFLTASISASRRWTGALTGSNDAWMPSVRNSISAQMPSTTKLDQRARELDEKISRQFVWLVSAHVTTLATIVAVLVAALLASPSS